jgi:uncharacterized protein involved in exopolysaccharide biosynthesis/Mrp family chromosome partitioning ATPase
VAPDGGITQAESQVSVIQSNSVLQRAIAATHLIDDPEFDRVGLLHRLMSFPMRLLGKTEAAPDEALERTLSGLRRHMSVSRADKVLVVDLAVTAQEPDKAARIANAIADAYLAEQTNARTQSARKLAADLSAHLASQKKRVQAAADAVEQYRAAHNLVAATGRLVSEQQLDEVSRQLSTAESRTAMLKARLEQIVQQRRGGSAADAVPEVMQSPVISQLRSQEATLVQRVADLEAQLGPLHPALAAARDQLRDTRRLINDELNRIARSAQADYATAVADEHTLSSKLAVLEKNTLSNDQAAVHLKELQRDLDAVRTVYSNYLLRAQEVGQQANITNTSARVITQALPPLQRSWPPTLLLLGGTLVMGLGFGAGIALFAESIRPTILSVQQAEALADAPVIAVLPAAAMPHRNWFLAWLPERVRRLVGPRASATDPGDHLEALVELTLRRIFESNPSSDPSYVRHILVTSSLSDAEARNWFSKLVVDVAANQGERVLMVDADLARNSESERAGLLDFLQGDRGFDSVLHFRSDSNAAFIAPGRRYSSFSVRGSQILARRMLDLARHRFDMIVVDSGAAAENAKAAALLTGADEVLLVARLNGTPRRDLAAAAAVLSAMGCYVTAVLLVDPLAKA